jgi:hypothetical protein
MKSLVLLLAFVFATGCTSKRWTCEACVKGDKAHCARSVDAPSPNYTEEQARCSASEQVCSSLVSDDALYQKQCKGERTSKMLGCSQDFVDRFEFQCTESTTVGLPIKAGP